MPRAQILEEGHRHVAGVREVNLRAFETPAEAELVDRLRARGALFVSLVAVVDGSVVGHIALSNVAVTPCPPRPDAASRLRRSLAPAAYRDIVVSPPSRFIRNHPGENPDARGGYDARHHEGDQHLHRLRYL